VGELDLTSYPMFAIASLALIAVVLLCLLVKKENEIEKLRQDMEAKRQATGATDSALDEGKVRQGSESKLETAISDAILDRIGVLDQSMEARFKELGARVNAANEVEKLRQEIELRFNIRFDKETFTEDDVYSFLFMAESALYRFDKETGSREGDENLLTEARGYIAMLNLAMAWARANGDERVRKGVNELRPRAEAVFKRMNEL